MSKGNVFENDWLLLTFNAIAIANIADNAATAPIVEIFYGLHTADPGEASDQSTNEIVYTGYARVGVARTAGGHVVTANSVSPAANIDFPASTSGPVTATHFVAGTLTSGAGKTLYFGTVTPNITINNGVTPRFTTASTITED